MDDLKRMAIFATVVAQGSLSAAARELGMSPSAVSQHLRALEQSAGVRLLHRSTRQISLTDVGRRVYAQCATLREAAERARSEMAAEHQHPSGELRLAAPMGFARHAAPALSGWLAEHPALRLSLLVDDAPTDLIQSRVDLALRFGNLSDSPWVARHLGSSANVLCASPAWLHAWGPTADAQPGHPHDLLDAPWLDGTPPGEAPRTHLWQHPHHGPVRFEVLPRITSSQRSAVQQLCEAGLGVAVLATLDVADALHEGRLVRLLPGWDMGRLDIWALTPERAVASAKVRQALAVLQAYFERIDGVDQLRK